MQGKWVLPAVLISIAHVVGGGEVVLGAPIYQPGFTWDWRVDFGMPTTVGELPPNPNSDAASRASAGNAGLSSGTGVGDVWSYGKAPYSTLSGSTFTAGDFTIFDTPHTFSGGAVWDDQLSLAFDWDFIGWVPGYSSLTRPAHAFNSDGEHEHTASVLRFTYPGENTIDVRISGLIEDLNLGGGDGIDWYILKNSSAGMIGVGEFGNGGSENVDFVTSLSSGDELFLAVGTRLSGSNVYDETAMDVLVEVLPEPSTAVLLLCACAGFVVRRHKHILAD